MHVFRNETRSCTVISKQDDIHKIVQTIVAATERIVVVVNNSGTSAIGELS
jgi:short-subunit dehydrogenase